MENTYINLPPQIKPEISKMLIIKYWMNKYFNEIIIITFLYLFTFVLLPVFKTREVYFIEPGI